MKRLVLLRHAKAVRNAPRDFVRSLAERGRTDMALVAEAIREAALRPDLALVSPAVRTRETWALAGLDGVTAREEAAIYEASDATLLRIVRAVPDRIGCVMLVGHNPGLETLAAELADPGGREEVGYGLPTAALVVLDLDIGRWREVEPGTARLARYVTPASLGGGPDA